MLPFPMCRHVLRGLVAVDVPMQRLVQQMPIELTLEPLDLVQQIGFPR